MARKPVSDFSLSLSLKEVFAPLREGERKIERAKGNERHVRAPQSSSVHRDGATEFSVTRFGSF